MTSSEFIIKERSFCKSFRLSNCLQPSLQEIFPGPDFSRSLRTSFGRERSLNSWWARTLGVTLLGQGVEWPHNVLIIWVWIHWTKCKEVPQSTSHLNGAGPCGAMKIVKSCTAAKQRRSGLEGRRFKTQCQQEHFTVESPLISTLTHVICIHNSNSCVRCMGWLSICFTHERCNLSWINKRSTRVVATF